MSSKSKEIGVAAVREGREAKEVGRGQILWPRKLLQRLWLLVHVRVFCLIL